LARPGGNITGVSLMSAASNAKNIELFHDMLPSLQRVGVLANAKDPIFAKAMIDEALRAGGSMGIEIKPIVMIHGPDEFESAFATMMKEQAGAMIRHQGLYYPRLCGRLRQTFHTWLFASCEMVK